MYPCSDTPFSDEKPVSRREEAEKVPERSSDTPFRGEKPVSQQEKAGKAQWRSSGTL